MKVISENMIGRIIKELKERGLLIDSVKVRFNGRRGRISIVRNRVNKKERRKGYKAMKAGDLVQIDSMVIFEEGIKRYIISGIDVKSRFGFCMMYDRLNSKNGKDFMSRLE